MEIILCLSNKNDRKRERGQNLEKPQNFKNYLWIFFFIFSPISVDSYTKMISMLTLLKPAVEKIKKKLSSWPRKGTMNSVPYIVLYIKCLLCDFEGVRKWSPKITRPSTKRGKCAPAGGHLPVLEQKKYNSWASGSKIGKTEKMWKLLIKFFFPFFQYRLTLVSKWCPGAHYLSQPSRKQKKSHSLTSKMDPQKCRFPYIVLTI